MIDKVPPPHNPDLVYQTILAVLFGTVQYATTIGKWREEVENLDMRGSTEREAVATQKM